MSGRNTLWPILSVSLLLVAPSRARADRPSAPGTGPYTVQMFQGGTDKVWLAVNPPTTYTNGAPIPNGTRVKIRVFRSMDGGVSYQPLRVISGGVGQVGQGGFGSRSKPWIDLTLKTRVENKPPYTIYLAVAAVVNGTQGAGTTDNLTFSYYPELVRYPSPAEAPGYRGGEVASGTGLAGRWTLQPGNGSLVIRQNGNSFNGTVTLAGLVVPLNGQIDGRKYQFRFTAHRGDDMNTGRGQVVLSADGRWLNGAARFDGATRDIPIRLSVEGRTMRVVQ